MFNYCLNLLNTNLNMKPDHLFNLLTFILNKKHQRTLNYLIIKYLINKNIADFLTGL